MATKPYTYVQLSGEYIRVLRILQATPDEIRVRLRHVDLDENPDYECLSYTWGDPYYHDLWGEDGPERITSELVVAIQCHDDRGNDGYLMITENLRQALLRLADHGYLAVDKPERTRHDCAGDLWIDAISINQGDAAEKNTQIPRLHAVYSKARTVVIWLGGEGPRLEDALELMHRLKAVHPVPAGPPLTPEASDADVAERLGIDIVGPQQWQDYAAFLQRGWFSRVWVLQEFFLARRVVVLCGDRKLRWEDLADSMRVLRATGLGAWLAARFHGSGSEHSVPGALPVANRIENLHVFEDLRAQPGRPSMEKLLRYARFFEATEAKDRVYGLMAMRTQSGVQDAVADVIKPDIDDAKWSVAQVYTEATWVALKESKNLNVLSLVEHLDNRSHPKLSELQKFQAGKDLPSWVPDWGIRPLTHPLMDRAGDDLENKRWTACGDLTWDSVVISSHGHPLSSLHSLRTETALRVRGTPIDLIVKRAAPLSEIDEWPYQIQSLLELLKSALASAEPPCGESVRKPSLNRAPGTDDGGPVEVFWRTLLKDTFEGQTAGTVARALFPLIIVSGVLAIDYRRRQMRNELADPHAERNPSLDELDARMDETRDIIEELSVLIRPEASDTAGAPPLPGAAAFPLGESLDGLGPLPACPIPTWATVQYVLDAEFVDDAVEKGRELVRHAFERAYVGRRLFSTKDKNLLGIGSESLEEGDEVWVLAGADVPMALRRVERVATEGTGQMKWRLVGEAYVHALMRGQALEQHNRPR